MRYTGCAVLLLLTVFGVSDAGADGGGLSDWHIYGSNTVRYDNFSSSGDRNSSPYRFTGLEGYDEFNLNFSRDFSPYNKVTGSFIGVVNDSRYRSRFNGIVPERVNIRQENGASSLPYRIEVGDLYAFQSYRTLQRSLKGIQLEFQPDLGSSRARHSVILFSGSGSRNWRDVKSRDGVSSGISWLTEDPRWGRFAANLLFNYKKADGLSLKSSTRQYIYSLAYENNFQFARQKLTVEGEIGHFNGDHRDLNGVGSGQNRNGEGYFAQISGHPQTLPALGYRFRFESYDRDYRPDTASIQPDRRTKEGHLSWRFTSGLTVRGRLQSFRTNRQTVNPLDMDVYGMSISGPLLSGTVTGLSGRLDGFRQTNKNRTRSVNTRLKNINASLNKTVNRSLSLRAGFFYSNNLNRNIPSSPASVTRQYRLGMNYRIEKFGITGMISPGFSARSVSRAGITNWEYNPTINISAARGAHSLSMSYSALDQNRRPNNLGLITYTAGLNYRYRKGRYTVGLDGNWFRRTPDNSVLLDTNAWRIGAFFSLSFNKPAGRRSIRQSKAAPSAPAGNQGNSSSRFALDISRLIPGMKVKEARKLVATAGLGKATKQPDLLIWFSRLLRDLDQNQRLVIATRGDIVVRPAVIIEFDDVGNPDDVKQTYNRTLRELLSQYGSPVTFFAQGDFGANMAIDLAADRFIRVMEWKTRDGVLRFGIPRRLDGKLRMELQFGKSFPALKDTLWSMEDVQ